MSTQDNIVNQRTSFDCSLCCIAMATGNTYEKVLEKMNPRAKACYNKNEGQYNADNLDLLCNLGFDWDYIEETKDMFKKSNCLIVVVPSLNKTDSIHAVYWDGSKIIDPSNRKKYTTNQAINKAVYVFLIKKES